MKQNQLIAVLLALSLFGCGVLAGVLGHRYYQETVSAKTPAADARQQYLSEMKSRVHLTSEQIDQLQAILDETRARTRAIRERYRPEMVKIKDEQISRVKAILSPQQIPDYERLVAERESRFKAMEERDRQEEGRRPHHKLSTAP